MSTQEKPAQRRKLGKGLGALLGEMRQEEAVAPKRQTPGDAQETAVADAPASREGTSMRNPSRNLRLPSPRGV
jgi:hypothetical protein